MKKVLSLILIVVLGFALMSADVTKSEKKWGSSQTYWKYTGTAADTLMEFVQDTIEFPMFLNKEYPTQFYVNCQFDTVDDNDNTVTVYLLGKVFEDEAWSAIANSGAVTIDAQSKDVVVETIDNTGAYAVAYAAAPLDTADIATITPSNVPSYYRYLLVRMIANGDNAGEGTLLKSMEVKIWKREF